MEIASKIKQIKISDIHEKSLEMELVVNFCLQNEIDTELKNICTRHKTGLLDANEGIIRGKWAQIYFTQSSIESKYHVFSWFDLFYRGITGQHYLEHHQNKQSFKIINHLDKNQHPLIHEYLESKKFEIVEITNIANLNEIKYYIGSDCNFAQIAGHYGVESILILENIPTQPLRGKAFILDSNTSFIEFEKIINDSSISQAKQSIRDVLCGSYFNYPAPELFQVLNHVSFIAFNFLYSNLEATPLSFEIAAIDRLKLQNMMSFLKKIEHFNQFALKDLEQFLTLAEKNQIQDSDIKYIKDKISEIDQVTEQAFTNFQELSFLNCAFKISKSSAEGDNIIEIAVSLSGVFIEMNQAISIFLDLFENLLIDQANQKEHFHG